MSGTISFSIPRLVLIVGEQIVVDNLITKTLGATGSYLSSNSSIFSIDNYGIATALTSGNTVLTATNNKAVSNTVSIPVIVLPDVTILGAFIPETTNQIEIYLNTEIQLYDSIENDFIITSESILKSDVDYKVVKVLKKTGNPNVLLLQLDKAIAPNQTISISYAPKKNESNQPIVQTSLSVTTGKKVVNSPETRLYPNITNTGFTIEGQSIKTIRIFNADGTLVNMLEILNDEASIDIQQYNEGIYFIEIETSTLTVFKTVIKIK